VRLIACGAGPSTQLLLGVWTAVAGAAPPYSAALPGFFSYSFALPRSAVPQLEAGGCPGYAGRSVGAELPGSLVLDPVATCVPFGAMGRSWVRAGAVLLRFYEH
jgi:hypothetical protein